MDQLESEDLTSLSTRHLTERYPRLRGNIETDTNNTDCEPKIQHKEKHFCHFVVVQYKWLRAPATKCTVQLHVPNYSRVLIVACTRFEPIRMILNHPVQLRGFPDIRFEIPCSDFKEDAL